MLYFGCSLFNPYSILLDWNLLLALSFREEAPKIIDIKDIAQGHTASEWWGLDSDPSVPDPKDHVILHCLMAEWGLLL